jgi:drug/metabolite transporter (DMT)-like permease
VVWGIVWGAVIFHERISLFKVVGALVVLVGVVLYAVADHSAPTNSQGETAGEEDAS